MKKLLSITTSLTILGIISLTPLQAEGGKPGAGGPKKARGPGARKMHKEMSEKFDANKDGELDETEKAAAKAEREKRKEASDQEKGEGPGKKRHDEMLKMFDANNDGKLDEAEKAAAKAELEKRKEGSESHEKGEGKGPGNKKMNDKMLKKFDANKDGELNETEKAAAKKFREEKKAERLENYDKDRDGELNEAERKAAMKDQKGARKDKQDSGDMPE